MQGPYRVTQNNYVCRRNNWIVDSGRDQPDVVEDFRFFHRNRIGFKDYVLVAHLELGREKISCGVAEIDVVDNRNNGAREFGDIYS